VAEPEFCQPVDTGRRFSGLGRLYGAQEAENMRRTHVVVVGLGGVGSWAAEALARSGIERLTLIDMDHVAESNINRQVQALSTTVGVAKIEAMVQRIALINPQCRVQCIDDFVTPENWQYLVPQDADAVIDACDEVLAKTAMAHWAMQEERLFIAAGAAGGKRMAHLVELGDLSVCTHDPLLAKVRYLLRKFHGAPREPRKMRVNCVFSSEAVHPAPLSAGATSDGSLNCHGYGSSVAVTASFGMSAAGWVMNQLARSVNSVKKTRL
jgi:tRNA A37 threonylcarbamoyladenosine dehydratase